MVSSLSLCVVGGSEDTAPVVAVSSVVVVSMSIGALGVSVTAAVGRAETGLTIASET